MRARFTLVLASSNRGKLAELEAILAGLPVRLRTAREVLGREIWVAEDGETFEQNAEQKARVISRATGLISLADDSGLEVAALGGKPGVRSARYAGENAGDAANNAKLLRALADVADPGRTARFRCALALKSPWERGVRLAHGTCEGSVARTARGPHGFGYDPVFIATELGTRTMAELDPETKNRISHRYRAAWAMVPLLVQALDACIEQSNQWLG